MRADRLISLLILLQTRGRMSAPQLARELEVSERTVYRDILALSAAGVPVYSETGCNGGFALVDTYRTNLTGLTENEVRALFMMSVPSPLLQLGVGDELRAAQLKLTAALSDTQRSQAEKAARRIHIDSSGWSLSGETVPYLHIIHIAIWEDRKLLMDYEPLFSIRMQRVIEPLGLVAKAGVWHLVYWREGHIRVIRLSDILNIRPLEDHFERPANFDLIEFWKNWCSGVEASAQHFKARVCVKRKNLSMLVRAFDPELLNQVENNNQEWIEIELSFDTFETARQRLLGFGRAVEVLDPLPLRLSILDFAEQIVDLYRD